MELRQLRYFVVVAEELHFGRAAARLHVVQPAVSQQVSRLEREVGLRLFDRSSRLVRLTPAGVRLVVEARAALAAADRVAAVAADLVISPTGVLRVGTSPGLSARLDSALERLRWASPELDIELKLVGMPVAEQLAAVARGELDMAFLRSAPTGDGLLVVGSWTEPVVAGLPTSLPLAHRPAACLRDLADLPLRIPSRDCDPLFHDFVLQACRGEGFEPRLGRPTGLPADALVEIGTGPPTWTLMYANAAVAVAAGRVSVLPLDPPLNARGCVVVSGTKAPVCVEGLRSAFGSDIAIPPDVRPRTFQADAMVLYCDRDDRGPTGSASPTR